MNLVLVTHSGFAHGIKSSLELVMGPAQNVDCVSISANETIAEIAGMIKAKAAAAGAGNPVVIISDIAGGSTTQAALRVVAERAYTYLITGLNLGLLLEAAMLELDKDEYSNRRKLEQIIEGNKSMMYLVDHPGLAHSPEPGQADRTAEEKI